ncbi:hypothetical protein C0J50_22859 [Silurus asotus]|uniref:RING-type domain-containing protein n=1 Tax=Silurus asotus TaxID=30991 RepID=A0AAD5FIY9_SILAS|nr:hypothetical protein C0J50_22859 [Silurus asotus]
MIPGYLNTTPCSQRTLKRRRLQEPVGGVHDVQTGIGRGFVPASSLLSEMTWLESPRPSQSTVSSSSTSAFLRSSSAPERSVLGAASAAGHICSRKTSPCGRASEQKILNKCNKERRAKKTSTFNSHGSSRCTSTTLSLGAVETHLHTTDTERGGGCIQEEIVVIDDDDDDMVVEATVRSIQMAEDEAFARSLQEQFDREEQFNQEQNRLQTTSPNRPPRNLPFNSYVGLSWISPWASMIHSSSFSELQQAMVVEQPSRQTRQTRGGRSSRHRNGPHVSLDMLDDSQGNNYEVCVYSAITVEPGYVDVVGGRQKASSSRLQLLTERAVLLPERVAPYQENRAPYPARSRRALSALLALEEIQGSVMGKKTLTKVEIERLPAKAYDPAHSAGKTECQICFSDYKKGEKLRMLPCFHDYHVKCIDRWLKENATCPICRADVST